MEICIHCGKNVDNRYDDNFDSLHTDWQCPYCLKWQNDPVEEEEKKRNNETSF